MQPNDIFNQYAINLTVLNEKALSTPLKDHAQIPCIIDTLGRKDNHHILLKGSPSEKIYQAILESIALHLSTGHVPRKLRTADVIYFNVKRLQLTPIKPDAIKTAFETFCAEAKAADKCLIFAVNDLELFNVNNDSTATGMLNALLQSKISDDQWRLIVFSDQQQTPHLESFFSTIVLNELTENERLAVLKAFQSEIENYHHILIPDEVFHYALSLTTHYLGGKSSLDKTLELLDSSAARASILERTEQNAQSFRPILTTMIVAHVVSSWTQISLMHLNHNKFKSSKFLQHLQQRIFGQDTAVNSIGSVLQSNCIKLRERISPTFNLILTGPQGVGKKEFAFSLSEYLFGHRNALLQVDLDKAQSATSLSDVFVMTQSDQKQCIPLLSAIQSKPYAVLLFENINAIPNPILDLFKDIFIHGCAYDKQGNAYDFRHATIIITTTLGAEQITALAQRQPENNAGEIMDLMQLVLNENANQISAQPHLSQHELREHILPALQLYFASDILRHSHIIPFMPLEQTSLEKIIKLKIHALAKSLEENFEVELSYAPEVIKFLAHEAVKQNENAHALVKLFEQHVYTSIASEILLRIDDKNKSKRLALLLNESGQILRCEFMTTNEAMLYKI